MTSTTRYRRGDVLREVIETLNQRRDGVLPMDLPGVVETYGDETALIGALQMRWHTLLAGNIECELLAEPEDLQGAVLAAWYDAAHELPGVRAVLDACGQSSHDPVVERAMDIASRKDRALMAMMAGQASAQDDAAAQVGARLEATARQLLRRPVVSEPVVDLAEKPRSLRERLRVALVA